MLNEKAKIYLVVFFLLLFFGLLDVTSIWPNRKSPTCDELAHHIPVGYILLTKGDFNMDPSHPPLPRYIVALPLKLFMNLKVPNDKNEWRREDRSFYGKDFFYKYNNQPEKMIFLSRLAVITVSVFLGIVLFFVVKKFYGYGGAVLSLFLYAFCPNIIANSQLATTDMIATCFIFICTISFYFFAQEPSPKNTLFAGITLGLAELSKYTAVALYPVFILLIMAEVFVLKPKKNMAVIWKTLLVFGISLVVIWAGYGFNVDPILKDVMRLDEKMGIAHSIARKIIPFWNAGWDPGLDRFLLSVPFPFGTHIMGICGVMRHGYEGHGMFFLGHFGGKGNPLYFVVAFLIKTPIPSIIFIFAGLYAAIKNGLRRYEVYALAVAGVLFLAASFSNLQLGLRYILPAYPFCFLIAARCAELFSKRIIKISAGFLIFWYIFVSIVTWPNYLSYFNEFVGGPGNGYKYLRDSNIDWGQDLPQLADYLKKNNIDKVKLIYFGTADPARYGIKYENVAPAELETPGTGVYAVSVHYLEHAKWAKDRVPTAKIGYSIYIYDVQ